MLNRYTLLSALGTCLIYLLRKKYIEKSEKEEIHEYPDFPDTGIVHLKNTTTNTIKFIECYEKTFDYNIGENGERSAGKLLMHKILQVSTNVKLGKHNINQSPDSIMLMDHHTKTKCSLNTIRNILYAHKIIYNFEIKDYGDEYMIIIYHIEKGKDIYLYGGKVDNNFGYNIVSDSDKKIRNYISSKVEFDIAIGCGIVTTFLTLFIKN